ncbi:MAG: hypothetical protein AAFX87_20545 [Bacteroidota bacterium]
MSGIAFNNIRAGKKYRLVNFGETYEFVIENIQADGDFKVKDIHTLEYYYISDLIRYGKGNDFEIREI